MDNIRPAPPGADTFVARPLNAPRAETPILGSLADQLRIQNRETQREAVGQIAAQIPGLQNPQDRIAGLQLLFDYTAQPAHSETVEIDDPRVTLSTVVDNFAQEEANAVIRRLIIDDPDIQVKQAGMQRLEDRLLVRDHVDGSYYEDVSDLVRIAKSAEGPQRTALLSRAITTLDTYASRPKKYRYDTLHEGRAGAAQRAITNLARGESDPELKQAGMRSVENRLLAQNNMIGHHYEAMADIVAIARSVEGPQRTALLRQAMTTLDAYTKRPREDRYDTFLETRVESAQRAITNLARGESDPELKQAGMRSVENRLLAQNNMIGHHYEAMADIVAIARSVEGPQRTALLRQAMTTLDAYTKRPREDRYDTFLETRVESAQRAITNLARGESDPELKKAGMQQVASRLLEQDHNVGHHDGAIDDLISIARSAEGPQRTALLRQAITTLDRYTRRPEEEYDVFYDRRVRRAQEAIIDIVNTTDDHEVRLRAMDNLAFRLGEQNALLGYHFGAIRCLGEIARKVKGSKDADMAGRAAQILRNFADRPQTAAHDLNPYDQDMARKWADNIAPPTLNTATMTNPPPKWQEMPDYTHVSTTTPAGDVRFPGLEEQFSASVDHALHLLDTLPPSSINAGDLGRAERSGYLTRSTLHDIYANGRVEAALKLTAAEIRPQDIADLADQCRGIEFTSNYPPSPDPLKSFYRIEMGVGEITGLMSRLNPREIARLYSEIRTYAPIQIRQRITPETLLPYLAAAHQRHQDLCQTQMASTMGVDRGVTQAINQDRLQSMARQAVLRKLMEARGKNLSPSAFVGEASRMDDLLHFRPMSEITTYTSTDLLTMYRATARTANERASSSTADRIDPRDAASVAQQILNLEAANADYLLYPSELGPESIYIPDTDTFDTILLKMRRGSPKEIAYLYQGIQTLAPAMLRRAMTADTILPYLADAHHRFQDHCRTKIAADRLGLSNVYNDDLRKSMAREAVLRRLMEAGKRTA